MRTARSVLVVLVVIACVLGLPAYTESAENDSRHFTSVLQGRIDMVTSLGIAYATAMRKCKDNLESKMLSEYENRQVERLAERTYIFLDKKLKPSIKRLIAMDRGDIPANIDELYAQLLVNLDEHKRLTREWCALSRTSAT